MLDFTTPSTRTAAEVSSHDVSMPRTIMSIRSNERKGLSANEKHNVLLIARMVTK